MLFFVRALKRLQNTVVKIFQNFQKKFLGVVLHRAKPQVHQTESACIIKTKHF